MSQFLVTVKEPKSQFVWDLLKGLDDVKIKKIKEESPKKLTAGDKRILANIEQGVKEFNLAKQGKIELQDAFEMLAEIDEELKQEGYHAD